MFGLGLRPVLKNCHNDFCSGEVQRVFSGYVERENTRTRESANERNGGATYNMREQEGTEERVLVEVDGRSGLGFKVHGSLLRMVQKENLPVSL